MTANQARAAAEKALATAIAGPAFIGKLFVRLSPPSCLCLSSGSESALEDGGSLHVTFDGLIAEAREQGKAHDAVAKELLTRVADPFEIWANGYKVRVVFCYVRTDLIIPQERLHGSRDQVLEGYMTAYEISHEDVSAPQPWLSRTAHSNAGRKIEGGLPEEGQEGGRGGRRVCVLVLLA